ncbi:MAG: hypothetical protein WCX17_01330 [Parcubacteria group bacterium]
MSCQGEKHKSCLICALGKGITGSEAASLIEQEIGPALAKKAGVTEETGRASFFSSLKSSGSTLQHNLSKIEGLVCFIPPHW